MATPTDSNQNNDRIEFIASHIPAIKDGHYSITVTQTVTGEKISTDNTFSSAQYNFSILGPRFTLTPEDIHAVFPPAGSLGEHSNIFPHIVFNRSTLPWERDVSSNSETPWLALLLFDEQEAPKSQEQASDSPNKLNVITYKELKNSAQDGVKFPGLSKEANGTKTLDNDDDKITVIDVRWDTLNPIMPSFKELQWLAHVRKATDATGNLIGEERAIIFGNRLPKSGNQSTVHLVSLEGFYNDKGLIYRQETPKNTDLIRLVSLKSWRFACVSHKHTFKSLLMALDLSTLKLPKHQNVDIESYYSLGAVPNPHAMRQGNQSVSWYHGPLVPGEIPARTDINLPVRAADDLTRYNPDIGMFDVSYSAAWELGRLIALQNKKFSVNLYHWKRTHAHQIRRIEKSITHAPAHLPLNNPATVSVSGATPVPPNISEWFNRLRLLEGIPFNYLVPDERMLPRESIRFFQLDPMWMECLLDGAFSIGRVTTADHHQDCKHRDGENNPTASLHSSISGFLLRSDVVSGWPGLLVDGYKIKSTVDDNKPTEEPLSLLRMDRLSPNVLLCLFDGIITSVDIHQKPELLHFGLDKNDDSETFSKKLRNQDGEESWQNKKGAEVTAVINRVPWKDKNYRTINIEQFKIAIENELQNKDVAFDSFSSALFALEMIEGVEKVRFTTLRVRRK